MHYELKYYTVGFSIRGSSPDRAEDNTIRVGCISEGIDPSEVSSQKVGDLHRIGHVLCVFVCCVCLCVPIYLSVGWSISLPWPSLQAVNQRGRYTSHLLSDSSPESTIKRANGSMSHQGGSLTPELVSKSRHGQRPIHQATQLKETPLDPAQVQSAEDLDTPPHCVVASPVSKDNITFSYEVDV